MKSLGHPPFSVLWHSMSFRGRDCCRVGFNKNMYKPRLCFPSLRLALAERKAVARCATRKTDTAINRIKTVGAHKLRIENTYIVNRIQTLVAIWIGLYSPIAPWHL